MSLDEFIEKFREFAPSTKWLMFKGAIRTKRGSDLFCPITFVNYKINGIHTTNAYKAGTEIGLTQKDVVDIMGAADYNIVNVLGRQINLRQSLMEAAGLLTPVSK